MRATCCDLERWGQGRLRQSTRYLHFHTCGNYAPGEIAWTLFDASAEFDGVPKFWENGELVRFLDTPEVTAKVVLRRNAGIAALEIQARHRN